MANHLPPKLKTADIQRFALRASQLETAKPAIAYWCEFWIVNHILAKGLHNADGEALQYTTMLMDKLEQTKARYATDDAIIDDAAGQAYVEQFGLETFERADRAIKADRVTKQTADTFLAAFTFLELLNIWGEPDPEILSKMKYARWNAARIAKAVKEGKDPNETNPKPEPPLDETLQPLDPNDPEVQQLGGAPINLQQASVEDVPDEQDRIESRLASQSLLNHSLHPSAQPSARTSPGPSQKFEPYPRDGFPYTAANEHDVSPIEPADIDRPGTQGRNGSAGGGYFPEVPTFTSDALPSKLGTAPAAHGPGDISPPDLPDLPEMPSSTASRHNDSFAPPRPGDPVSRQPQDFYNAKAPPPQQHVSRPPQQQHTSRQGVNPAYAPSPQRVPGPPQPLQAQLGFVADDMAMAKAQKHARFAISALTFDDPDTAVKELRAALQTLGAN